MLGVKENNFLGKGISLDSNLNLSTETVKGKFKVENKNYKNSDKSLYLVVDASETDRLTNSGYKFNKTGFEIGSGFEYYDDLFLELEPQITMKELKQIILLQLDSSLKKVIILICF